MRNCEISATFFEMSKCLSNPNDAWDMNRLIQAGEALLLCTGAKAWYLGNGRWKLGGYTPHGEDILFVVRRIHELRERRLFI